MSIFNKNQSKISMEYTNYLFDTFIPFWVNRKHPVSVSLYRDGGLNCIRTDIPQGFQEWLIEQNYFIEHGYSIITTDSFSYYVKQEYARKFVRNYVSEKRRLKGQHLVGDLTNKLYNAQLQILNESWCEAIEILNMSKDEYIQQTKIKGK